MNIADGLRAALSKLLGSPVPDKQVIEETVRGIQRALLLADVRVDLVKEVSDRIKERALQIKLPPGISRRDQIVKIVYDELVNILGGERKEFVINKRPFVIMMVGIQGTGKTTSVAKLAKYLSNKGYKVGIVVADVYRPAALEQVKQLVNGLDILVYGEEGTRDPLVIARRGIEYMRRVGVNVVIIDTAGRHKEQEGLMDEIRYLYEAIRPDSIGLVIDATIGQQAGPQAEAFHKVSPVGWIMLTKMDTSARGGGALAAVAATGAPILFIGTGEKLDEIERFDPRSYVARLLGLPDLEGIIERVRSAEMKVSKEEVMAMMSGKFTIEDLIKQLREVKKMGPLDKLLNLLPLPKSSIPAQLDQRLLDEQIKKWEAIVNSMTREERIEPNIIDSSRARRIARGAGVTEKEVKVLVKQYNETKRAMRSFRRMQQRFILR